MGFKENLKNELEYQGMQVKELAAKCGISRNTLGNYLTGHNSVPSADTAVKIARALGVSVEYLVTGTHSNDSKLSSLPLKYRSLIKTLLSFDEVDFNAVKTLTNALSKRYEKS